MAAEGEREKRGWIDWRVFWTVLFMLIVGLPLLAFLVQRLITPG
jgi:hypothetical protein